MQMCLLKPIQKEENTGYKTLPHSWNSALSSQHSQLFGMFASRARHASINQAPAELLVFQSITSYA